MEIHVNVTQRATERAKGHNGDFYVTLFAFVLEILTSVKSKDFNFSMRTRAYEKHVTGKHPLDLRPCLYDPAYPGHRIEYKQKGQSSRNLRTLCPHTWIIVFDMGKIILVKCSSFKFLD